MSRLAQLEKLYSADPNDADVAYMIAHEHAKTANTPTALHWFDTCLKLNPSYHYAYYHKARAQQAAQDIEGAMQTLRLGLEIAQRDGNNKATNEITSLLHELGA
ncbi:MAG: hypothetical protein ACKVZJ_13915 [Phycisphaerales bacterium]